MFNLKPFSWRQAAFAALVSSAVLASSCSDDDAPVVDGDPTVKVTSSATSDVVWNTVTLTIEASDDKNIAKIEVKVDGTVAGTQTSSPYDFKWDTQKVTDGSHTIAVTATDDAGKEASWQGTLKVQNTLLEFTPTSDMLDEGEQGYVFLSTSEGKTIAVQEFENGKPVKIIAPGYDGKDFTVTQVSYRIIEGNSSAGLQSTTEVPRGKWALSQWKEPDGPDYIGQASLTFTGADTDYQYVLTTNGSGDNTYENEARQPYLKKDPSILYIRKHPRLSVDETYEYTVINQIKVGTNPEIDLTKVNKVLTAETISIPAGDFNEASINIYGLRSATNRDERYSVSSSYNSGSNVTIRYPGSDFPAYFSESIFRGENTDAKNYYNGVYDNKVLNATIGLTFDGTKFAGTVSGTADYIVAAMEAEGIYWEIITNKGKSVVVPEIPASLHDLITVPDFNTSGYYADVTVCDRADISDYADLLNQAKAAEWGFLEIHFQEGDNAKQLIQTIWENGKNGGSRIAANSDHKIGRHATISGRTKSTSAKRK